MRKGSYSKELVKIVDDTVNLVTPVASLVWRPSITHHKIQGHTFEKSQWRSPSKSCNQQPPGQDPRLRTNGHSDTLSHETLCGC